MNIIASKLQGAAMSITPSTDREPVLEIAKLRIEFRGKSETVVAIPELSFKVMPGESYGLVGESGCGKSTTAMAIMGYLGNTGVVAGGSIRFNGKERLDVEEYCISEGWIKVPAGKTVDRKGHPLLLKLKGTVEVYYR